MAVTASRSAAQSLPVVPGGEGFGMSTRAAYACGTNPTILRVTNLNDSGAGSLRAALEASGPRVVIFETSGTLTLASDINVTQPCLTIAGQTAPSPGVTIRNGGLTFYAHDILIQHLRVRPGDGGVVMPQTAGHDTLLAYSDFGYHAQNIVYDHVSLSWAGGKNANIVTDNPANLTYWRCIISEALYRARNVIVSSDQPSSLGMLLAGNVNGVSVIGNLFAHNSDRNPEAHEGNVFHFINNVVYDWGKDANNYQWATLFYAPVAGPWKASIIGNKYIAGPPPSPFTPLIAIGTWSGDVGSQLYMSDNAIDQTRQPVTAYMNYMGFDPRTNTPPVSLTGITVRPSSTVESFVLANAGARPLDRDAVDKRIVNEVTNRTGNVISSQNEVGGWPTLAVNVRALTPPDNPHTKTAAGYTNLEVWLQGYAAALEGAAGLAAPKNVHIVSTQ
jgi:hypothetical protein